MECRSIDVYLAAPLSSSEEKENSLLKTLQGLWVCFSCYYGFTIAPPTPGMVCSRLKGRAPKVLVGLGRHLRMGAKDGNISKLLLEQAMRAFHISLTVEVSADQATSSYEKH